jgi:uncharacterized membrane protein
MNTFNTKHNVLQIILGTLMAALGLAIQGWLWLAAKIIGPGLVNVFGEPIPMMMPIIASLSLVVFGFVISYLTKSKSEIPHL